MIHVPETVVTHVGSDESYTLALLEERATAGRTANPLPEDVSADTVEHFSKLFANPGACALLATVNEKPAGFSLSYPVEENTEYLSLLMVDPDFQGRGIASRLVDIIASRAANRGDQRLALWTAAYDNNHAQSFYEHRGFIQTIASRTHTMGIHVRYEKDLTT